MAQHKVKVHLPGIALAKDDVVFVVNRNNAHVGRLQISQGRLDWFPGRASKRAHPISWKDFIAFAENRTKRVVKKRK